MAVPLKNSLLRPFADNFSTRISATPVPFGFSAGQATTLAGLVTSFTTAYDAMTVARSAGERSTSLTAATKSAKAALLPVLRGYYEMAQGNPAVTDANKELLGITLRALPSKSSAPAFAPTLKVLSKDDRTIRLGLGDAAEPDRKGRPVGTAGASVFSFIGSAPPADLTEWVFQGNTGRTTVEINFDPSVPNGSTVYVTAFWFNGAKQSGPAADPLAVFLPGGGVSMAA